MHEIGIVGLGEMMGACRDAELMYTPVLAALKPCSILGSRVMRSLISGTQDT